MANHPSAKRLLANRREGEWPAAKRRVGELSITANHPSAKRLAANCPAAPGTAAVRRRGVLLRFQTVKTVKIPGPSC